LLAKQARAQPRNTIKASALTDICVTRARAFEHTQILILEHTQILNLQSLSTKRDQTATTTLFLRHMLIPVYRIAAQLDASAAALKIRRPREIWEGAVRFLK
jgi:hypothetical protein